MQVAVIDDGINEGVFDIGKLNHNIEITKAGQVRARSGYDKDLMSHGTVCAAIIHKYAPTAALSSIKVLNEKAAAGNVRQLRAALKWCLENHIEVVNLSLGSTYFKDFRALQTICNELFANHICIIAAQDNNGLFTVPACLSSVIGVKCNMAYDEDQFKCLFPIEEGIDIEASSAHSLRQKNGKIYRTGRCNSYAAPLITAKSVNLLVKNSKMDLLDIKQHLMAKEQLRAESKRLYDLSYLSEAYLINLSPRLLLNQLCFKRKEMAQLVAGMPEAKMNLVLVTDKEEKISEDQITGLVGFLKQYESVITTVALCGQKIKAVEDFITTHQIMYWSETDEKGDLKIENLSQNIELPVVYFCGEEEEVIEVLQAVSRLLAESGYNSLKLSDFEYSCLYGFQVFPRRNASQVAERLYQMAVNKTVDLILVGLEKIDFLVGEDLIIEVNEYKGETVREIYELILAYYK